MPNICDEDGDGSVSCHECCRAVGKIWLLLVCLIFLTLGVLQVFVAFDASISSPPGIASNSVYFTYSIGGSMIVVCIIGIVGVYKMNRCWLGLFTVLMVILALLMLVVSIMISSWMNTINSIETTDSKLATDASDAWLNNYLNCTYQGCCTLCPSRSSSSESSSGENGNAAVGLEYCRKYDVPCNRKDGNLNPTFCKGLQHTTINDACTSPPFYRGKFLQLMKRQSFTVIIILLSSFGVILISLGLSCYFTLAKKIKHVMDNLESHHHARASMVATDNNNNNNNSS
jgi:hypothetical protein|tara:strand:- start:116 stop:973 length:858 start_codon:yes stop_codon:yes gene_type:complete